MTQEQLAVVRQMEPIEAGIKLAPTAAPLFYADDDTVLQWFKDRGYANASANEGTLEHG